jgi:plasmid maintenance system antidote protein VapI
MRCARALDTTPGIWLNLQNAVDIFGARRKLAASP